MTTIEKQVRFLHPYNYKAFNSWSNFFRAISIALIDCSFSVIVFLKELALVNKVKTLSFSASILYLVISASSEAMQSIKSCLAFFAVTISSLSAFFSLTFGILPFFRFLHVMILISHSGILATQEKLFFYFVLLQLVCVI